MIKSVSLLLICVMWPKMMIKEEVDVRFVKVIIQERAHLLYNSFELGLRHHII